MSQTAELININNEKVDDIVLNEAIFSFPLNEVLIKQYVLLTQANKRLGLASTKNRKIVSGGGKKPWKQKGTGRARAGSSRSPLWKGGGVIFGPTSERNYNMDMPKKARKGALKSLFAELYKGKKITFIEDFEMSDIKTKSMVNIFKTLNINKGMLILPENDDNIIKSARNLYKYKISTVDNFNIVDLLKYENIIISKSALNKLEVKLLQ
ncbi:MAG: 50S ribosomal protein L4 [Candidatus Acididesulfobacter guangdongensis]|uniref:Large ribosomal subunit protein uL4 n=1 Tax=Acididesulfobacter guangdongensis TaxID=2597225 RepID=A0A519BID7_ACIG2|nr:MAG: 50S ribosomal protein L4 [Candidatus Acididesulfobacter guangdongensis]